VKTPGRRRGAFRSREVPAFCAPVHRKSTMLALGRAIALSTLAMRLPHRLDAEWHAQG
jgi:hypothetical protein